MMFLAFSSAVPIFSASCFTFLATASLQATGTAITSAMTTAIIGINILIPFAIGAPPYLVFIVRLQQYNSIMISQICQRITCFFVDIVTVHITVH